MSNPLQSHFFISGFMGSGKSTIATSLSNALSIPYLDTDKYIENKLGISINEIFQTKGEDFFRNEETITLKEISQMTPMIISLGGGIVIKEKNREILKTGNWININTPFDIIIERITKKSHRPLITGKTTKEIKELFDSRKEFYAYAPFQIDAENKSSLEVADDILKLFKLKS